MKTCRRCGNKIPDRARTCPYCDLQQHAHPAVGPVALRPKDEVKTINLKKGFPPVHEALQQMKYEIDKARSRGFRVVRLIHGYGSTGTGGKIKQAVREELAGMQHRGDVKRFVVGHDGNPGVTRLEL